MSSLFDKKEFNTLSLEDANEVGLITVAEIETLAEDLAFQGYNPEDFFKYLMTVALKISPDNPKAALKYLIKIVTTFYVIRGSRMFDQKVLGRTQTTKAKELLSLIQLWGIMAIRPRNTKDISIGRILGCVPIQIMSAILAAKTKFRVPVTPKEWPTKATDTRLQMLPNALLFPGAVAVIPKTWKNLYAMHVHWQMSLDKVINEKGNAVNPANVIGYSKITWESAPWSPEFRLKAMQYIGLGNDMSAIGTVDELFNKHLEDNYDPDEDKIFIKKMKDQHKRGSTVATATLHTGFSFGATGKSSKATLATYDEKLRSENYKITKVDLDSALELVSNPGSSDDINDNSGRKKSGKEEVNK